MGRVLLIWLGVVSFNVGFSAVLTDPGVYLLPMNCSELLPDPTPFSNYLEAVGRGLVADKPQLASRIFKILAIRSKVSSAVDRNRDQHPIDVLIRKTLCFYRDTKEPLKPVTYDDSNFVSYLASAMPELETKVGEVVYQFELEQAQKKQFEKILEKNSHLIEKMKMEADQKASNEIDKLVKKARNQVKDP